MYINKSLGEFVRCLCPSNDHHQEPEHSVAIEITLAMTDTAGMPMPKIPAEALFVTVSELGIDPPDICFGLDPEMVSGNFEFLCGDNDTLFATGSTDVTGVTVITRKNVYGAGCLELVPCTSAPHVGVGDTVWVNSCDQVPAGYGYHVLGPDFGAFSTAYTKWVGEGLENWAWDLVADSVCTTNQGTKPVFTVRGSDLGAFSTHYTDSLEVDACD
jgi:hypothetical protein